MIQVIDNYIDLNIYKKFLIGYEELVLVSGAFIYVLCLERTLSVFSEMLIAK